MAGKYAEGTDVPFTRSLDEIKRTLRRFGAILRGRGFRGRSYHQCLGLARQAHPQEQHRQKREMHVSFSSSARRSWNGQRKDAGPINPGLQIKQHIRGKSAAPG